MGFPDIDPEPLLDAVRPGAGAGQHEVDIDAVGRLPRALAEKRMGVWSMRERMRLLGGRLRLASRPGKGTTVTAEVPIMEGAACPKP